jgi:hypothetical protein
MKLTMRAGVVAAILLLASASGIFAQHDYIPYVHMKPLLLPKLAGPAKLEFVMKLEHTFDSVAFTVKTEGGISYSGPMAWVNRQKGESTFTYILDVVIPPNDTSGIGVDARCCNGASIYFVTTGDTLETYYWARPKAEPKSTWPPPPPPPKPVLPQTTNMEIHNLSPHEESLFVAKKLQEGRNDSTFTKNQPSITPFLPKGKIHPNALEDDQDREWKQRQARHANVEQHVVIDLRKEGDYEYAKGVVRDLTPMPDSGFYHGFATKTIINKLADRKINCSVYHDKNEVDSSAYRREHKKVAHPPIGAIAPLGWQYFWSDGFEGSLQWTTQDLNGTSDADTWDEISRIYTWVQTTEGMYSAWCSARGSRPVFEEYDNDMNSWLYAGFDVRGFDTLCFEYDLYLPVTSKMIRGCLLR